MAEKNAILVNAYSGGGGSSSIASFIIDYKTFGKDSYVYNNKDVLHAVYEKMDYSMNDNKLRNEAFDYLVSVDEAGPALAAIEGISSAATLKTLAAMSAVAASSTAMSAVAASSTAMSAIIANRNALNAVLSSSTAMSAVAASSTAMSLVVASSTAINAIAKASVSNTLPFWKAANSKLDYVKAIYATITGGGYRLRLQGHADRVSVMNGDCGNMSNTIIFTATGYYSSSSASTNVIINGTTVLSGSALRNTIQPKSVTSSNVGAVSVPTTTWTENGDGYAAAAVYNLK